MNLIKYWFIGMISILFLSCIDSKKSKKEIKVERLEATSLPYFNSSDLTPTWEKGIHKIPDFSFLNQNGEVITNKKFEGKIYVADFFFATCPGICPKLTKNMGLLQEKYLYDDAIQLLSHTVMPWNDSVLVLQEYAEKYGVLDRKWNLLTGNQQELYNIVRNGYFADEDFLKTKDKDEFIHTENFILVDGEGYIRGLYNGTIEFDVKRLMRHIELLKEHG